MKKYRTDIKSEITEHEILWETTTSITFLNKDRSVVTEPKKSNSLSWHESKHDAMCFLSDQLEGRITELKQLIRNNNNKYNRIRRNVSIPTIVLSELYCCLSHN